MSTPDPIRPALLEVLARRALTEDAARPEAVERLHERGGRTAREQVAALVDPGSFVEYGRFVTAAQEDKRSMDDLLDRTVADGIVGGLATIGGRSVAVLSYDYLVMAGTQGMRGHRKTDRLLDVVERLALPCVFFAAGGGGRPGDTDIPLVSALDVTTFAAWARLSGRVPRIAVVEGPCFAGNAVVAGCSDLVVATPRASLGMGGPAMIAGGGLGEVSAAEVGPLDVMTANGVVDVAVDEDDALLLVVFCRLAGGAVDARVDILFGIRGGGGGRVFKNLFFSFLMNLPRNLLGIPRRARKRDFGTGRK